MKSKIMLYLGTAAALTGTCLADAADVTGAVSGIAADASTGVTAGVTIGAIVFGARVVWGAIKSMAH